ncbi:SDR family oxidoreductase [Brevundimonas lenta]|uniref:D-xylose 1-dehydrogenase n=1 Tax=Brevundimonas lenta TaxID=424796 RepID=A0A7W6NQ40_9CAUL|nr:SDR family oxidoreductase [Brevundimonas lenta]MBB4084120.1 NAD(P)-dependent dehydrogenase (short-subunit alcohol dehydrogenase family) [Brevundimonas lenta]
MTFGTTRLDGQVALVTGGAGILGRVFCRALVEAGAKVAVVDLLEDAARDAASEHGEAAAGFGCDVSDPASVKAAVAAVMARFGRIDVLVNNAATKTADVRAFFEPFETYKLDTWREVMGVNVDGMFLMAQAVGAEMLKAGSGRIVQTASIYGLVGPDDRIYEGSEYLGGPINTPAVYSASKAAVVGLTKWLATHWADKGIRVNCLVPGGVSSGQNGVFEQNYSSRTPMGRMAQAEEMAPPLLFLASEASSYVTGQVLAVDGGWTAW